MSGGTVRKLESRDKDLALRLETWLNRRDELRASLRLFLALHYVLLLVCLVSWDAVCVAHGNRVWVRLAPAFLGSALYFCCNEIVERFLSSLAMARLLSFMLPLARLMNLLLLPLSMPLSVTYRWIQRRRYSCTEEENEATAEDEIMSLVEQDANSNETDAELEADERRMIRGIFDLDETLVREIMTPRVDVGGIAETASIMEVRAKIVDSGHSRLPVYRDTIDRIVGVIYAKDLLADAKIAACRTLSDIYHRPVFIPETKNVGDLLAEFQQNNNHFAVVLDEYGGTAGVVTFEDILEEIVGEIRDEYDLNEADLSTQFLPDGALEVDARISIAELNEMLDIEISEDDDFDTLGGYISAAAGRIPQAGETIATDILELDIIDADPRRVRKARVRRRQAALEKQYD